MGLLTGDDSMILRDMFKECCKLRGFTVDYLFPVSEDVSIYGQIFPDFSSIIELDIMFETNPKIKTLKNYGWVSEDKNEKPYIAYLPYDTKNLQTKARIRINPIGGNKAGRWFEITDITEAIEYPMAYACKLAPLFINDKPKLDYDSTNYNYLEGGNQPDENTTQNKEINKSLEKHINDNNEKSKQDSQNFTYLNI